MCDRVVLKAGNPNGVLMLMTTYGNSFPVPLLICLTQVKAWKSNLRPLYVKIMQVPSFAWFFFFSFLGVLWAMRIVRLLGVQPLFIV